ncbi:histidine kinase [Cohnella abietis]|uniref:Uncharacterized protein n=1 Tax=Cohnella abietis TaxID=2507935 RepID=A0A3T1DAX7_9BACL|nr:histidine kinase [Cohnella abietis]BBI35165.1 hypothetical protein KCTCHS21_45640 [Cohnella abietis]
MNKQNALFQDLKQIRDSWINVDYLGPNTVIPEWSDLKSEYRLLNNLLSTDEGIEAFKKVIQDKIDGVLHSVLVMIDGGTELAEKFTIDLVVEDTGESLKEGIALHEEFTGYLLDAEES